MKKTPEWFRHAVGYQIFPPSFQDSNGDGIGDLPGIIRRLDYLQSLGIGVLWLSPCFDSPFMDAGYDISDFKKVAPRYGKNGDLKRLFREAERRGIRVLLDFVPGHTSIHHPWFRESCRHQRNAHTNRYVWSNGWWTGMRHKHFINGYAEREGSYQSNFFWFQPKLNYGHISPSEDWHLPVDHPDVKKLKLEMREVMRHWLDLGASGFRVDSAGSLVLGDTKEGTIRHFQEEHAWLKKHYPDAVTVSEWAGRIGDALNAGFDASFLLHNMRAYNGLFTRSSWKLRENYEPILNPCFFEESPCDSMDFLTEITEALNEADGKGFIALPTSNHDCRRVASHRSEAEMKVLFAFVLSMPSIPFIYYGEEIGMDYVEGLTSKEGAYPRTGSRTPMQWDSSVNAGFSSARASNLYLPLDDSRRRPTVESQERRSSSLLNEVKRLIALRKEHSALGAESPLKLLHCEGTPLVYRRGDNAEACTIALNPSKSAVSCRLECSRLGKRLAGAATAQYQDDRVILDLPSRSYGIWKD